MGDAKSLKISIKNSPAKPWTGAGNKPDDASIIIAEVSVADGVDGTSYMAKLQFTGVNESEVYFLDDNGAITGLKTKDLILKGSAVTIVKFTAEKSLSASITGALYENTFMVPKSSDTQKFTFSAPLDKIKLDISPTESAFDGKIYATVSVTAGGVAVEGQQVSLDLNKLGPAVFVENPEKYTISQGGYSASGNTDKLGNFEAKITPLLWGGDYLIASISDRSGNEIDHDTKGFTIMAPEDLFMDLIVLSSSNDDNELLACGELSTDGVFRYHGYAAADGKSFITIYGFLGRKTKSGDGFGGEILNMAISGGVEFDQKTFEDPNDNYLYNSSKEAHLKTQASGKTQTLTIRSTQPCRGSIIITRGSGFPSVVVDFEFFDPWTDVSSVSSTFMSSPNFSRRLLFANGNHFAGLKVMLNPRSPRVNLSLSSDTIRQHIRLIDNVTQEYLGMGDFYQWRAYDTPPNDSYGTALFDSGGPMLEEEQPSEAINLRVVNYYITSTAYAGEKGETDSYTFGLEINPPGMRIEPTDPPQRDRYGNVLGEAHSIAPITYCTNGTEPLDLSRCPSIRTLEKRTLTGDDLKIDAFFDQKNINDDAPVNSNKVDVEDNFYRFWRFEAYIDNTKFAIPSEISSLNLGKDVTMNESYVYGAIDKDLYSYRVYLWPFNVDPSYPPKKLPSPNEMKVWGPHDKAKVISYLPDKTKIYFAWYANFSVVADNSWVDKPLTIYGHDQYGNELQFIFYAEGMPTSYQNSGQNVGEWNPFRSGLQGAVEKLQNRSDAFVDNKSSEMYNSSAGVGDKSSELYNSSTDSKIICQTLLLIDAEKNGVVETLHLHPRPGIAPYAWSYLSTDGDISPSNIWALRIWPGRDDYILHSNFSLDFPNCNGRGISGDGYMTPARFRPGGFSYDTWIALGIDTSGVSDISLLMLSPIWSTGKFAIFSPKVSAYYYCLGAGLDLNYGSYNGKSLNYEFYLG